MANTITAANLAGLRTNPYFDALIYDGIIWETPGSGSPGIPVHLTYAFDGAWSSAEKASYRKAFQSWANVAEISVSSRSNAAAAEFVAGQATFSDGTLGQHTLPSGALASGSTFQVFGLFDRASLDAGGLRKGGYAYTTFVHEIGHGLGLGHPHASLEAGSIGSSFPGVSRAFGDYGDNNLNQGIFTVMSYNDGWAKVQRPLARDIVEYGYVAGPMALDIAVAQALYGANESFRGGSDVYVLPGANKAGTFWQCLWDTGGIDSIVYRGAHNVRINLNDATLANASDGGGIPSNAKGILGGFTIANGVVIEQAKGGNGNDRLTGNEADNSLWGRAGNDRMYGGEGADSLAGGAGNDGLHGGGGADVLSGGRGNDRIFGDYGGDVLVFNGGDDVLAGLSGTGAFDTDADTFVILNRMGEATIRDFGAGDTINLAAFGLGTFDAVMAKASDGKQGVVIRLDSNTEVVIAGLTKAGLDAGDFIV